MLQTNNPNLFICNLGWLPHVLKEAFWLAPYISANTTLIFMKLETNAPEVATIYPNFSDPDRLPPNRYYKTWGSPHSQKINLSLPIQLGSLWNFKPKFLGYHIFDPTYPSLPFCSFTTLKNHLEPTISLLLPSTYI